MRPAQKRETYVVRLKPNRVDKPRAFSNSKGLSVAVAVLILDF
jgi:hypothetical protein